MGVEDLFGEELEASPQEEFKDGVYTVKGKSMKQGTYRSGKWEGRPFARFLYEMTMPDGEVQQVSQMLPWMPGKAFFEINFKQLTGMSLSDFNAYCRSQGFNDSASQSKFFLERFKDVEYEVEIKKSDRWFNVWEIKRRIEPQDTPEQPLVELKEIFALQAKLGFNDQQLEDLCQEEFSTSLPDLAGTDLETLRQLLAEKSRS